MRGARQTIRHDDGGKGINALPGVYSASGGDGLSEGVNVFYDADDTLRLRALRRFEDVTLSSNTQGLWRINGRWYTVAKRGDTATHTGTWAANVTTLFFDPPPDTTAWTLKAWDILDDTLCAWIEHDRNSSAVPKQLALHVFDGFAGYPTFVFDPALPQYHSPELPQQFAGPTDAPVYAPFTPVSCVGHGKLWAARPDGNVQFCGIGRPRVWSPRDATSIETDGVTYYHVAPNSGAVFSMWVPEVYADLIDVAKVTTYKVQRFDTTTRAWVDLTVTAGVPTATQFRITAASQAWNSTCTRVEVGPQADGTIVRFLVIIKIDLASAWYIARHQVNLDYWSADGEADFLYTAGQEANGETITALSVVRNRLFVGYQAASSLWQVGALSDDSAFLDSYQFGATAQPTLVGPLLIVSTQQGPRGVSLDGQNFQGLADRNLGRGLPVSATVRLAGGAFWPWNGLTVFRATANWTSYAADAHLPATSVLRAETGATAKAMVLQWSDERQILAWFWWDIGTATVTSDFLPVSGRLYFRSGANVAYFDGTSNPSVGDQSAPGGAGTAFTGYLSWHFRKVQPRGRFTGAMLDGSGVWTLQISTSPWADIPAIGATARLEGQAVDRQRAALTGTGPAYALVLSGSSADTPTLNAIEIEVVPLGR